jgi:hypothetical protein
MRSQSLPSTGRLASAGRRTPRRDSRPVTGSRACGSHLAGFTGSLASSRRQPPRRGGGCATPQFARRPPPYGESDRDGSAGMHAFQPFGDLTYPRRKYHRGMRGLRLAGALRAEGPPIRRLGMIAGWWEAIMRASRGVSAMATRKGRRRSGLSGIEAGLATRRTAGPSLEAFSAAGGGALGRAGNQLSTRDARPFWSSPLARAARAHGHAHRRAARRRRGDCLAAGSSSPPCPASL